MILDRAIIVACAVSETFAIGVGSRKWRRAGATSCKTPRHIPEPHLCATLVRSAAAALSETWAVHSHFRYYSVLDNTNSHLPSITTQI